MVQDDIERKAVLRGKFTAIHTYLRNKNLKLKKNKKGLNLFLINETRTRINKNKVSRRKKTIKIRLLINEID